MGEDIIVNENFFNEDSIFDSRENLNFESQEILDLKKEMQETDKEKEENIEELISYDLFKKNLSYDLPYQRNGALTIMRDMNTHALLADEVGLGKTITTGMVIKESFVRGFAKKILILTPPSLVDQWVAELREKFDLNFSIIESAEDWVGANLVIASIDRVKIFDTDKGEFKHKLAQKIAWDLVIVDEAHKLKERNTVRWRFVDGLQKKRFLLFSSLMNFKL